MILSVHIHGHYLGCLFNVSYAVMLFCEPSHSDEGWLSLQINFSSAAFKHCPTEEKDVDSNFPDTGLMQRNWTASIYNTTPEKTVAVYR